MKSHRLEKHTFNHMSNIELLSGISEKLSKFSNNETTELKKQTKQSSTKDDIRMANKYIKIQSTLLATQEMKIKPTMKYQSYKMANRNNNKKKPDNTKRW